MTYATKQVSTRIVLSSLMQALPNNSTSANLSIACMRYVMDHGLAGLYHYCEVETNDYRPR